MRNANEHTEICYIQKDSVLIQVSEDDETFPTQIKPFIDR